ncbi:MAG TPA: sigma-54 dependent transcriptional regulator [bacterium]|nr:sigma-54 dependent transcriptional regulator [bacterium]
MKRKAASHTVLLIDDEESIRTTLAGVLSDEGFRVLTAADGAAGLALAEEKFPDLVLLDIWMPGMDGIDVLKALKERWPELPVVMISGHGTVETAVKATKLGAFDFIEKPLSIEKVVLTIEHALELTHLSREYTRLRKELMEGQDLIGDSKIIRDLKEQIAKVGPTEGWVLLTGENGTGKEVVARSIHRQSLRKDGPFVEINCAAIPEELIESELFGYEKGAFTGAEGRKVGKFDLANGGTLLLDEIADMSLKTQSKVLRILQEQQFERVGGTLPVKVDVRVIAATNRNLEEAIKEGKFREDLYYRLNVIPIVVAPLRERKEDVPLFVEHFLKDFSARSRLPKKKVNKKVLRSLTQYPWPGNVRELKNVIERMLILSSGDEITMKDLPPQITSGGAAPGFTPYNLASFKDARAAFEREYLVRKLMENDYNISQTAEQIGMERTTLHRKIKSYGIETEK